MPRLSSGVFVLTILLSPIAAAAQGLPALTCNPAQIDDESYSLATDAQALNVTRPRTNWWDGFDASLRTHQDALGDLNDAALVLAERAIAIDDRNLAAHSELARQLIILGQDGARARAEMERVFDHGGALVWTATLYDVDAKSFFLMAFDRERIRVYRFGEAAPAFTRKLGVPQFPGPEAASLWRAMGGCLDRLTPEATVPWADVHEIAAGNFVVWIRFKTPVLVKADGGKKKSLKEFKVALHGAMGSVEYRVTAGDDWWDEPKVTGVGIGPSNYQDRVRRVLVAAAGAEQRIAMPKQKKGAGW